MKPDAFPRPPPFTWDRVEVRDALPVYPPPGPLEPPSLPSSRRKPVFESSYTLTSHLFPACHLRTTRLAPVPKPPPSTVSKEKRRSVLAETALELQALRTSKETDGYPRVLWNCANRYVKNDLDSSNRTGVTLFFAHANGFQRRFVFYNIFEPTLGYLLSSSAASIIDEVWVWESVHHGDAGLINAPLASGLFDWQDDARDIANFFLHYLPKAATLPQLHTHLYQVSPEESEARLKNGFSDRNLVAVGHSLGGCTLAVAASLFPTLFNSLVLLDPVIIQPDNHDKSIQKKSEHLVSSALSRRESWASWEEALESFTKNPFFRTWHPAVLKVYVECGLYLTKNPNGKEVFKLKMPGIQEAVVFSEWHTQYEAFDRVSRLDERIAIRWVIPGKLGAPELGQPGSIPNKVWVRPANSTNSKILGAGHLIAQEAPQELAENLNDFLLHQFSSARLSSLKASL